MTELDNNDLIREDLGMEVPLEAAQIMQNAYHVYTDGSFTGYRNVRVRHASHRKGPKQNQLQAGGLHSL